VGNKIAYIMKKISVFILVLATAFFTQLPTSSASTPVTGVNDAVAGGVTICWTTKKGKRICVGITVSKKLMEVFQGIEGLRGGMEGGQYFLQGWPASLNGESFLIDKPQTIGDNLRIEPGKYTINKGTSALKMGTIKGETTDAE
jgi:hypothetical protein